MSAVARLDPNRVPAEPIASVVRAYLDSDGERIGEGVYEVASVTLLAERVDILPDTLSKIVEGRSQTMDFNLADRLLCVINMNDLWWTDLSDIYLSTALADGQRSLAPKSVSGAKICERRGCSVRFVPPARGPGKRFCSNTCRQAHWGHLHRDRKTSLRGKGRELEALVCRHGHPRTKEDTGFRKDGGRYCLICHRASDARRRQRERELRDAKNGHHDG